MRIQLFSIVEILEEVLQLVCQLVINRSYNLVKSSRVCACSHHWLLNKK